MPYLEDVLAELDEAAFDPATDVKELFELGGTQPGGGDTFSLENGEGTLVYIIDWRKARAFTRWCLGFCYADKLYPYKLHRENPQVHPKYPLLTAATVHFSAVGPKANDDSGEPGPQYGPRQFITGWNDDGTPIIETRTVKVSSGAPNYPAVFTDTNGVNKLGYYSSVYCTVRYVQRPWTFRPDAFVTSPLDELKRNCYATPSPVVELLTADGGNGQMKWSETGSGGPAVAGDEAVVTNLFATRVSKMRYLLNWMWVPESYLSTDPDIFFPEKLLRVMGRVNSRPFLGRPAGTLLCDAPKMERFQFPVCTFDGLNPFYGWNIQIPLTYFNPTLGVPDADPTDDTKARGHRTLPWRANGKWYGAKREDTSDPLTQWLIEEADFSVMLQHVSAP